MRSSLRLLVVLLAVVVLASCGDDDGPVAAGDGTDAPGGAALADEYVSIEVTEGGSTRPLVEGTQILLRFDGDTVGAQLGCNTSSGRYAVDGDVLSVDGMASTEMGCAPELHAQDEWFAAFLVSGPTVALDGDVLTLTSGPTVVRLVDREVAQPDASLVGTTWELDGFADGRDPDDAAMSSAAGSTARVRFEEVGFVTGHDGCNSFGFGEVQGEVSDGLRYEVDGERLVFEGNAITELMACPDRADEVERFWAALHGTVTWSIDGDRLELVGADGRVVTFRSAG